MNCSRDDHTKDSCSSGRDSNAMAEFITDKQTELYEFIKKRTGVHLLAKLDVDDILQDVLSDALKTLQDKSFYPENPLHWLYTICERKIIDSHRRFFSAKKRSAAREARLGQSVAIEELLAASITTPSAAFSRNENQLCMLAALETLPADQQEALRLRYLSGLPSKEIALRLGKSDGAIRVMLSRGIARLQILLGA